MIRRDPRKPTEFQIHVALADYLRRFANPDVLWLHVPNAAAVAKRRILNERMGVRAGVWDLLLIKRHLELSAAHRSAVPRVLWLELKSAGKKPTHSQKLFELNAVYVGCECVWADSIDSAIKLLQYGGWCR
jgi:hypothetical protein